MLILYSKEVVDLQIFRSCCCTETYQTEHLTTELWSDSHIWKAVIDSRAGPPKSHQIGPVSQFPARKTKEMGGNER